MLTVGVVTVLLGILLTAVTASQFIEISQDNISVVLMREITEIVSVIGKHSPFTFVAVALIATPGCLWSLHAYSLLMYTSSHSPKTSG